MSRAGQYIAGIGVDMVEHERFGRALDRHPLLAQRMFNPEELAYASRFSAEARIARLAARFAAKEAVSKAMGITLFSIRLREICVVGEPASPPVVRLSGSCLAAAQARGIETVSVSLSHERSHSIAFALAFAVDPGQFPPG